MAWSEQTEDALRRWVGPGTWQSGHNLDKARFSVFVASVWNDEHKIWNEGEAREIITETAIQEHKDFNVDETKKAAERHVSQGTEILDFLSHVSKKDKFALLSPTPQPSPC